MFVEFRPTEALRILVLAGGPSSEREISLKSGRAVAQALTDAGHCVSLFDPRLEQLTSIESLRFDVAFIALHGRYGEDGGVQQQLEAMGLPYTGSGSAASAMAFSKSEAKTRFVECGVSTPAAVAFDVDDSVDECVRRAKSLGFPVVVKPDRQGSSIGISFAHNAEELASAIETALAFDSRGIIEVAIAGEEWTVPLLDEMVLPPIRIATPHAFFDYEAKYLREDTAYEFPEDVPIDRLNSIVETAQRAARSLGVASLSRVDLRVDHSGTPWVLEVNTVPGLTDHSLAPKSAARRGMSFSSLCEEVCLRAIASHCARSSRHDRQNSPGRREIRRAS
jgi:D-alanine-D-alanine ligase